MSHRDGVGGSKFDEQESSSASGKYEEIVDQNYYFNTLDDEVIDALVIQNDNLY